MKTKQWVIAAAVLLVILSFAAYNAFSSASPEFMAAKEFAMTATPDEDGDYLTGKKDGEVIYIVGYFPKKKYIGGCIVAGPKGPMFSVIYDEGDNTYVAITTSIKTGKRLAYDELTPEKASKIMHNILNHLVNSGIQG